MTDELNYFEELWEDDRKNDEEEYKFWLIITGARIYFGPDSTVVSGFSVRRIGYSKVPKGLDYDIEKTIRRLLKSLTHPLSNEITATIVFGRDNVTRFIKKLNQKDGDVAYVVPIDIEEASVYVTDTIIKIIERE